jgi:endonuclease YncB( thermonuclease family)
LNSLLNAHDTAPQWIDAHETVNLFLAAPDLVRQRAYSDDMVGRAGVIDGDTLEIHGARIRLWGGDAPESTQLCRRRGQHSISLRRASSERACCNGGEATGTENLSASVVVMKFAQDGA